MNATEPNTSVLSLFAMLGQSPDSGLPELMNPEQGGLSFAALMTDMTAAGEQSTTALPGLTPLQTLPQEAQTLPLLPQELPLATAEDAAAAEPVAEDLLGQIRQARDPLSFRPVNTTADSDQDDDQPASDDDTDAAAALLFADNVQPADITDAAPAPAADQLQAAGLKNGPAHPAQNTQQSASDPADAATADDRASDDGADFFLPDNDRPAPAGQQHAMSSQAAQNAAVTTPATDSSATQPAAASAALAASSQTALTQPAVTTAATVSAEQSQSADDAMLNRHAMEAGDKLEFGHDRRQWGATLGARIVTMVADDVHKARIHLDPPELGSLEIKLHVSQDQATVQVHAQNPQVREVLENSVNRLRDALASQGLNLSGFDVTDQGRAGGSNAGGEGFAGNGNPSSDGEWAAEGDGLDDLPATPAQTSGYSLLDTFA